MDRTPNLDDANLILRLYELRREPRMREARRWFASSFHANTMGEFQRLCPPGSEENASYRMLTSYWEMAASFVTRGILHRELFFENCQELLFLWERVRELLPHSRAFSKNPKTLANVEQVATEFQAWWKERAPEYYPVFQALVRGAVTAARPAAVAHLETPHTD